MKPKESFDTPNLLEAIQTSPLAPTQISVQLGAWLQLTTNLTQLNNQGTITYTISTSVFSVSGDTTGSTNATDPKLTLSGNLYFGTVQVGTVEFHITSDLSNQQSTADVFVTFGTKGTEYPGIMACWGQ